MNKPPKQPQPRNNDLAKIHIAKKQLHLDDETYRDLLWTIARVRSAKDLDAFGRKLLLEHFKSRGVDFIKNPKAKPKPNLNPDRKAPAIDKAPLINKIRAMLDEEERNDEYANGIANKMFHVTRYEWCTNEQLRKIVAALNYDKQRRQPRR